ncbi:MAG TPA: hypothetical protein VHD31_01745 [Candidatus Paceibacterota bacterium]|nr:hypothetical protein [Candidatus Paceibacterota bacterium]
MKLKTQNLLLRSSVCALLLGGAGFLASPHLSISFGDQAIAGEHHHDNSGPPSGNENSSPPQHQTTPPTNDDGPPGSSGGFGGYHEGDENTGNKPEHHDGDKPKGDWGGDKPKGDEHRHPNKPPKDDEEEPCPPDNPPPPPPPPPPPGGGGGGESQSGPKCEGQFTWGIQQLAHLWAKEQGIQYVPGATVTAFIAEMRQRLGISPWSTRIPKDAIYQLWAQTHPGWNGNTCDLIDPVSDVEPWKPRGGSSAGVFSSFGNASGKLKPVATYAAPVASGAPMSIADMFPSFK